MPFKLTQLFMLRRYSMADGDFEEVADDGVIGGMAKASDLKILMTEVRSLEAGPSIRGAKTPKKNCIFTQKYLKTPFKKKTPLKHPWNIAFEKAVACSQ